MEETKRRVIIIGGLTDIALMGAATARLAQQLDMVFVAQLEAKAIELDAPKVGPWLEPDDVLDAKAMAAAMMPTEVPVPPCTMKEREQAAGVPQPYRGYMNSRQGRRRRW